MRTKRFMLAAVCALLFFCDSAGPLAAGPDSGRLDLPPVSNAVLANGIRLFYVPDDLPQITIIVTVGYGRLYEKRETAGLSDLLASTMSLGGSTGYPGATLHEAIDSMGGRLSVSASWESVTISIRVLERFREEAFAIAADIAARPNIEQVYLDNASGLVIDSIKRKYDNPFELAFEKAREIIFEGQGYGAVPTEEKIRSYSRALVQDAWKTHFAGRNMMIGVSSSIDFSEAERLCRKHFSGIHPGAPVRYETDNGKIREQVNRVRGKVFLYRKDIPQSTVVVGTVAPDIRNPGVLSLDLMNYILGGGSFSSRLMEDIRVKRGMAYAVQSVCRPRYRTGVFLAYAQTENRQAGEVLGLLVGNIERMASEPVAGRELTWAQGAISNAFVFRFDTPMEILSNYLEIAYNELPEDYYKTYLGRLNRVSAGEIVSESAQLLTPGLVMLVVGHPSVEADLKRFGEVVIIE